MKKIILLLLILVCSFSFASRKKIENRIYSGTYSKVKNVFSYTKDNLILPNKDKEVQISDPYNLLDPIYDFLKLNYEVTEDQDVNITFIGREENKTVIILKVVNYQVPLTNLEERAEYIRYIQNQVTNEGINY